MCVNTEHQQLLGSITLSFKNSADMNKYYGIRIIQRDQDLIYISDRTGIRNIETWFNCYCKQISYFSSYALMVILNFFLSQL